VGPGRYNNPHERWRDHKWPNASAVHRCAPADIVGRTEDHDGGSPRVLPDLSAAVIECVMLDYDLGRGLIAAHFGRRSRV
jgi:hypothetical protein